MDPLQNRLTPGASADWFCRREMETLYADSRTIVMKPTDPSYVSAIEGGVIARRMALFSDAGVAWGALIWATNPKPLNARFGLQALGDDTFTQLECEGQRYRIDFENQHDSEGRKSGVRFLLRCLDSDDILGEVRRDLSVKTLKRPWVSLVKPAQGAFVARWKWFRSYWRFVDRSGSEIGYIGDPSALSFKRELHAVLPGLTRAQQALCLYVFCHINYMGSSAVPK